MNRPIMKDPAFLAQRATAATKADAAIVTDLQDTLAANRARCVGMAANMIGFNKRVIIVAIGPLAVPMINPQLTAKHGAYQTQEGCLSLTGERQTTRYQRITVRYQNTSWQWQTQQFEGFVAQIIQHEVDHCEGILI